MSGRPMEVNGAFHGIEKSCVINIYSIYIYIYIYYMTCEISSANMGFYSANIGRYYMVQQLIAQLHQRAVKRKLIIKGGKPILSLIYLSFNKQFITVSRLVLLYIFFKYPAVLNDYLCYNQAWNFVILSKLRWFYLSN